MAPKRLFSVDNSAADTPGSGNLSEERYKEVQRALNALKDENGRWIDEMDIIHSLGIDDVNGIVSIKLNLSKDYRKAKSLITK